jgi:serine/threonine-protein kinase
LLAEDSEQILIAGSIELLEELGRGGMGVVYRARQVRLDRTVAVKFLSQELASQPDFQARFDRECKALAMLRHPGIVEIHDSGSEDGLPFLVMEYVVGGSLAEAGKLAPERAIAVALQICSSTLMQRAWCIGTSSRATC